MFVEFNMLYKLFCVKLDCFKLFKIVNICFSGKKFVCYEILIVFNVGVGGGYLVWNMIWLFVFFVW